jgi:hypothetical protein
MCEVWSDGDGPAVSDERGRRARKQHKCDACGKSIKPGDVYAVNTMIAERGSAPERENICDACDAAREELSEAHDGKLYPLPSYLKEALRECIREEPHSFNAARWERILSDMHARAST